jgi:hypothetical protein
MKDATTRSKMSDNTFSESGKPPSTPSFPTLSLSPFYASDAPLSTLSFPFASPVFSAATADGCMALTTTIHPSRQAKVSKGQILQSTPREQQ